jgi:hypothetical protein
MADCSARNTLEALYDLTDDTAGGDIVRLNGPAPVTLAAFDDALAEAQKFELPSGTLGTLKRVRALLAQAAEKAAAAGSEPVTRAEFEAAAAANALALVVISDMFRDSTAGSLASRLEAAAQAAEFASASSGIQALLGRLNTARRAEGARQLRRASGRLQVVPGGGGRNF